MATKKEAGDIMVIKKTPIFLTIDSIKDVAFCYV